MSVSTQPVRKTRAVPAKFIWLMAGGLVLMVLMSAAGYFVGRAMRPYQIKGTPIEPPIVAQDFTMTSARSGQPVSLSDFEGKFVFVYFGYATCPDVCPATLSKFSKAYQMLTPAEQNAVQLLWITVDPARDTPEVMEEYVSHFTPEFMLGVIPASEADLAETAQSFYAHYEKIDYGSEAGYLMDHTAGVALVDPQGIWRMVYPFGAKAEDVAADLKYLIDQDNDGQN
ncbi:MAG: SCO family protein [Anaerolineae bacterium]